MGADQSGELGKGFLEELTSGQVLKMSSKVWQMGEDVGEGLPRFWLGLTGPSVKPWVRVGFILFGLSRTPSVLYTEEGLMLRLQFP